LLRLDPDLAIAFWDERWSTQAMQRLMIEQADLSRARRAELIDKMAAAYILQGALDRIGNG
jgi:putative Holliday junction resolvase